MTAPGTKKLGKVYLVGAGPGDPRLITVRGAQCLAEADLVLYDYLVNPALLDYCRKTAERVCLGHPHHAGRAIAQEDVNRRLVDEARLGKTVLRLKSGDPHLFGRGAEETEALTDARIPYEVVPGVTAAMAAASHAGIPITHRQLASAVAFITGHQQSEPQQVSPLDFGTLARFPGTLVIYMGMTTARHWAQALIDGGKSPETPAAVLRRLTWPDQSAVRCTLATLADVIEQHKIKAPAVIVVGETVGLSPIDVVRVAGE